MKDIQSPITELIEDCEKVYEQYGNAYLEGCYDSKEPLPNMTPDRMRDVYCVLHWARCSNRKEETTSLEILREGISAIIQECRDKFICWGGDMGIIHPTDGHEGNHIACFLRALNCQRRNSSPLLFTKNGEFLRYSEEAKKGRISKKRGEPFVVDEDLAKALLYSQFLAYDFPCFNAYVLDDHARQVFAAMKVKMDSMDQKRQLALTRKYCPNAESVHEHFETFEKINLRLQELRGEKANLENILKQGVPQREQWVLSAKAALRRSYPPLVIHQEDNTHGCEIEFRQLNEQLNQAAEKYNTLLASIELLDVKHDEIVRTIQAKLKAVSCEIEAVCSGPVTIRPEQ